MDGPPELTSAQLHAGPGTASLIAASQAWTNLAAQLSAAATRIRALTGTLAEAWRGPSADHAIVEVQHHAAQINALADRARTASAAAVAAATAFTTARTTITAPAIICANRANIAALQATNVLGQHTPTIAALETAYETMWARNTTVMHAYAAQSTAATNPLDDLLNGLDGASGTPLGDFLNSTFTSSWTNVLASGLAPTGVISDVTGFGFLTAFLQQSAAMQTIRDTVVPPRITVEAPAPVPATSATAGAGRGLGVGALTAPPGWARTAQWPPTITNILTGATTSTPAPPGVGLMPTPLPSTATGQRRTRDDPEYGDRPTIMTRPPAGG